MDDPEKGDPMKPCMDVYKEKIQSDGFQAKNCSQKRLAE